MQPQSFLSEMQNVQQRRKVNENQNSTLADQLRTRLEERRKSKEEDSVNSNAAFVPESIAADIQKAVKMANETSKFFEISISRV